MKKMRFFIVLLVFVAISCNFTEAQWISGNKKVIQQERKVSDITKVKVSNGIDLLISQGNSEKLIVETDENLQDLIVTEVRDGVLKIYSKKSIKRATKMNVFLTVTNIEYISSSSGSDVMSKTVLKSDKLDVSASSGSDINVEVKVKEISCETSSGSDAKLSGTADRLRVDASSGSDVDAFELEAKYCSVDCSSGSDVNVHVTEELDVDASSGSDVNYKGKPLINADLSSGGDLNNYN